ncbi:MAG TPA: GNAT family N-acetyltransferase [Rickettsiales bacterium]|nr:GNAT family N-acetyltransferase [Rickettsiales bacterium]
MPSTPTLSFLPGETEHIPAVPAHIEYAEGGQRIVRSRTFNEIFNGTQIAFDPSPPMGQSASIVNEFPIFIRQDKHSPDNKAIFNAIREVLLSDEITQYCAGIEAPDFGYPVSIPQENSNLYSYKLTCGKGQAEVLASHIQNKLIAALGRFQPIGESSIFDTERRSRIYPPPSRNPQPYKDIGNVELWLEARSGEKLTLCECKPADLQEIYEMALSGIEFGPFTGKLNQEEDRLIDLDPHSFAGRRDETTQMHLVRKWLSQEYRQYKEGDESIEQYFQRRYDATYSNPEGGPQTLLLKSGNQEPPAIACHDYLYTEALAPRGRDRKSYILKLCGTNGETLGMIEGFSVEQAFGKGTDHTAKPGQKGIGYVLLEEAQGKGLAIRGSVEMVRFLYQHTGATSLYSGADPDNEASLRILFLLGFRPKETDDGKIKFLKAEQSGYTDKNGIPRPRVEMEMSEEAIMALLTNPQAIDTRAHKDTIENDYNSFIARVREDKKAVLPQASWRERTSSPVTGNRPLPPH